MTTEAAGEVWALVGRRPVQVWLPDDVHEVLQEKAAAFGTHPVLLAEAVIRATVPRLHTGGPRLSDDELRAYCDGYCRGLGLPAMPNDYDPPAGDCASWPPADRRHSVPVPEAGHAALGREDLAR